MTNNFPVHYPRFEKKTPTLTQETMNTFYSLRYPKGYDAAAGLIRIPQENGALKYDVAEIDTEKLLKYPRIRFFVDKNPQWQQGVELACIAQVDMTISLRYVVKRIKKIFTTKGSQK